MAWPAIIAAIWGIFGPFVTDLIKKLLDSLFNKATQHLPDAATFATPEAAQSALIDKSLAMLPFWAWGRKALVRRMKAHAAKGMLPLSDDEAEEIRGLSQVAELD